MASNVIFLVGVVTLLALLGGSEGACPNLYISLVGRCYFFSQSILHTLNFDDSRLYCQTEGAGYDLLVLDVDFAEFYAVVGHMRDAGYVNATLGLSELGLVEEMWAWTNGIILELESPLWDCGYPNLQTNRDCGHLKDVAEPLPDSTPTDRFRIRDNSCLEREYFICEGPVIMKMPEI